MLKTAMIFTDKMVLQRGKPIPVWGEAVPGTEVVAEFDGCRVSVCADADGKWRLELPEHGAGTGYVLKVCGGGEEKVFSDVCVGEVWLAGGQSNMEYLLGFEKHFDEVIAGEMDPLIRFFDYPEVSYEGQLEDYHYINEGFWRGCTPEDLAWFSAVGYYFARNLRGALDIPIGIVGCSWGGTPASTWMDPEYLRGNDGEVWLREYEEGVRGLDVERYKAAFLANPANDRTHQLTDDFGINAVKIGLTPEQQLAQVANQPEQPVPYGPWYERRPGGLYGTMLKKIHPYAIRGAIWYQGETDSAHPEEYVTVFSQMIRCWRELWGEEFPFLFVQLAPFYRWLNCWGKDYPRVRASQEIVSRTVPNAWMASIGDAGMEWDIHPKDKLPVGTRLALLARGHVYGEELLCDAPEFSGAQKRGDCIEVTFCHANGLTIAGSALNAMIGITKAGEERAITSASVSGDKLSLHGCADITALRFAWTDYYEVNLYNASGIPAKPFRAEV